jgi:hypothetical protein
LAARPRGDDQTGSDGARVLDGSVERQPATSRLVYICDWLPPDFGAVGQYSLQFARQYAEDEGHDVVLVGLTGHGATKITRKFARGSLAVIKIQARRFDRERWRRRLAWTIVTDLRILTVAFRHLLRCDRIVLSHH